MIQRVLHDLFSIRARFYRTRRPVTNDSIALSGEPLTWGAPVRIRVGFFVNGQPGLVRVRTDCSAQGKNGQL